MRFSTLGFGAILGTGLIATAQTPAPAQPAVPVPRVKIAPAPGTSYIGVMVQEIDSERAKTLKLHEEAGVEITHVTADSPADKAGLKPGDAILQYNGQRVEGIEQFSRLVRETPPGREVKLDIYHNGAPQTVMVKLVARHPQVTSLSSLPAVTPQAFEFRMPDMPRSFMSWQSSMLGIEGESLDGQLAQYFGVKEGVLVRSVTSGSAAEKGGIKAGDVIVRVDDSKVTTPTDVTTRLRSLRGKQVAIVVMRDHREVPLTVTIEEDRRGEFFWRQNPGPGDQNYFTGPEQARMIGWPRE